MCNLCVAVECANTPEAVKLACDHWMFPCLNHNFSLHLCFLFQMRVSDLLPCLQPSYLHSIGFTGYLTTL